LVPFGAFAVLTPQVSSASIPNAGGEVRTRETGVYSSGHLASGRGNCRFLWSVLESLSPASCLMGFIGETTRSEESGISQ